MAIINATYPRFQVIDANGNPLVGGKVYVYEAGTTTDLDNWTDSVKTAQNTQPVILDSTGCADIWYEQSAKIDVKTAADVTVEGFPVDNLSPNITAVATGNFNAVINGSFEIDSNSDSIPDNWTVSEETSATIAIDATSGNQAHGVNSLKFSAAGSGGGTATTDQFEVAATKTLQTSWWFKQANAATGTFEVDINWYQDDGSPSATASTNVWTITSAAPTAWTEYKFGVVVPSDAVKAELVLTGLDSAGADLSGECWFDHVRVFEYLDFNEVTDSFAGQSPFTQTGIPEWATRIQIIFFDITISAPDSIILQLGTSSGLDTTGNYHYGKHCRGSASGSLLSTKTGTYWDTGTVNVGNSVFALNVVLVKVTGNSWVMESTFHDFDNDQHCVTTGQKTLTGTLDRFAIDSGAGIATLTGDYRIIYEA